MNVRTRLAARRQLDKRLKLLAKMDIDSPQQGWVKAIRTALGMTMAQMASRLGVSQSRIATLERAEAEGAITLKSLERAAEALECRLVYALIPRQPINEMVADRAALVARRRLDSVRHHMTLEDQAVDRVEDDAQLTDLARKLAETAGSALWE